MAEEAIGDGETSLLEQLIAVLGACAAAAAAAAA
eukprot:COSAG06_NODE_26747_length_608_cov_0.664047_1_plen_33_part_10